MNLVFISYKLILSILLRFQSTFPLIFFPHPLLSSVQKHLIFFPMSEVCIVVSCGGMVCTWYVGGKGSSVESLFLNKDVHLGGDEFAPSPPASDSRRGFGKSYSWGKRNMEEKESECKFCEYCMNRKTSVSTRVTC